MIVLDIQKSLKTLNGTMNLDIQLEIEEGEFVTLYGESGVGKTSTLRMLSGLLKPDQGKIVINGETWFDSEKKINLSPQQREIGYVFQDYALFPNMTVLQNLEFAAGKNSNSKTVSELIDVMELELLKDRKTETLSGGQKQRVALARALAQQPKLLLLDEPLAALDIKIRLKLQDYIRKMHNYYGLTTILISHDIGEIIKLSDRVFVIENGKNTRKGTPKEVFIQQKVSGKFSFTGEVLTVEKQDVVYVVTVLIHTHLVQVIAQENEIKNLMPGDKVLVASKAFNPIIYRLTY